MSRNIRVAIVDDQRMFLDGIESWLTTVSSEITVTIKSLDYRGLLEHPAYPPDVVVLDADLRDGTTLVERLERLSLDNVRVIVVSTLSEANAARQALAAGAVGYISKSESAEQIAEAITAAVDGRDYLAPAITALLLEQSESARPTLSVQEQRVMVLYGAGLPVKVIASQMNISQETVRTYLKRIRSKYVAVGVHLDSKVDFHLHSPL